VLDHILLEPEQEELLVRLVEAARSVPAAERQPFVVVQPLRSPYDEISHPALPGNLRVYPADLAALRNERLVAASSPQSRHEIDVTPRGFAYYRELKQRSASSLNQIDIEIREYLDTDLFQQRYPEAYRKWAEAAERLWASDSERELTRIGHDCREALQAFVTTHVERFQPSDVDPDKQHDRARFKAVLDQRREHLGETERLFLDALYAYWGTLSALVQRQEHGAQRDKGSLVWEDGRRVVFQAAVVMYEVDRSLGRTKR
jgi:hypothetical protein